MLRLARDEARLHAFVIEEMQNKVADRIIADRGQQRRLQAQAFSADADIRRRTTDIGGVAVDFDEGRANIVRIQVN